MIDENEVTDVTENEQEQIQAELVWDICHKNCDKVRISDN